MTLDLLIRGATVHPGVGPATVADVSVAGGRIAAVERLVSNHHNGLPTAAREIVDGTGVGTRLVKGPDHIESAAVRQAQIDDRIARRGLPHLFDAFCNRFGHSHLEAADFHGACQPGEKRPVVVDEQESLVLW